MRFRVPGTRTATVIACAGLCLWSVRSVAQYLTSRDVLGADQVVPDVVLDYGPDPNQFGHLYLPEGEGPFPVLVVIHGGCWLSFANLGYLGRFAKAFAEAGIATWNIEYRRVDNPGGGWPNTFLDVANGIDVLRTVGDEYRLDLNQVVAVGHSAGGHLALWAAARPRIDEESVLYSETPLPIVAAVSLAGPGQLAPFRDTDNEVCGGDVIDQLLGGSPDEVPDHYAAGSPIQMLPLGVPQRLITGVDDPAVPPTYAETYAAAATKAGDDAVALILDGAAHFEAIVPGTDVWPEVQAEILGLFEEREQYASSEVEQEIWALEEAYMSAFENAKHSEIVELLHRDFLGWPRELESPSDRSEASRFLKDNFPEPLQLSFELDRAGIRVSGDAAITHYIVRISEKGGFGERQVQAVRITHTWIRDGADWKILGGMSSTVPGSVR